MSDFIPLSEPHLQGNEWKYIKECLDSNWVSSAGKYVDLFEQKIAEYTGAKHAIACVNGTAALQVSLRLAGVKPGDEVIAPTLTFIAPINAIAYNGADPVFMDADDYYNVDSNKTIQFIHEETELRGEFSYNKSTGKRISAIVPVHVWGNACWLDELTEICQERNITIVEDASESLGTRYTKGNFAGRHTGTIGKLGCISFNGNKIITTGGGGMILTDDDELAVKARYLTTQAKDDDVSYIHNEIGYNFRLTNIQAAMGVAQLEQLTDKIIRKGELFRQYKTGVSDDPQLLVADPPHYAECNYWVTALRIGSENTLASREKLMQSLSQNTIQTRPVWHPNHLQRMFTKCQTYVIENTNLLWEQTLCLPNYTHLKTGQVKRILDEILLWHQSHGSLKV